MLLAAICRSLELSGLYQLDRIDFPSRAQQLTAQIARVRARGAINASTSVAAFVQYNGLSDAVISNLRVRYNPREGTDLYIVFNEVRNAHDGSSVPPRPAIDSRTLLVKFARTMNVEF